MSVSKLINAGEAWEKSEEFYKLVAELLDGDGGEAHRQEFLKNIPRLLIEIIDLFQANSYRYLWLKSIEGSTEILTGKLLVNGIKVPMHKILRVPSNEPDRKYDYQISFGTSRLDMFDDMPPQVSARLDSFWKYIEETQP